MTRAKRLLWISAAKNGPFSLSTFQPSQKGNLQEKTACPVIDTLQKQFPQSVMKC